MVGNLLLGACWYHRTFHPKPARPRLRVSRRQAHPGSWRKDRDPDSDCPPLRHSAPSRTELEVGLNIPEAPPLLLQNSVNWRHRMVHLAVPLGFSTFWIKAERGSLGKNRLDSFRGLNTTDVSTHTITRPKSECEVSAFLLSFSVESIRTLPALLIAVCQRRDQVYGIATMHSLSTNLGILLDNATYCSERRQESQA